MATRKQLREFAHISLPPTIPCHECGIPKAQNQYSANRLADVQKHIIMSRVGKRSFDPASEKLVRCSLCVGGPAPELECHHCEITYPKTDRYYSKIQRKKDDALCWSCSQRQQNDTLSDSEDDSSCSNDSDLSRFTEPYKDADLHSTISGHTSTARGKNSSSIEDSSGGVLVDSSSTRSSVPGGTTWTGMSNNGSTRGTATSATSSYGASTQTFSIAGSSAQSTPARSTASRGLPKGFNPNAYSQPCGRSPPSSMAGSTSSKAGSQWAKVDKVPTAIDMDAARNQPKHMNRRAAAHKAARADMQVSEDNSD